MLTRICFRATVAVFLLGLVVVDAAAAQRRRREQRQETRAEETQQPSADPGAVSDADLVSSLGLFVYPADGQDTEQQATDQTECAAWARQQVEEAPETKPPSEGQSEKSRREERREGDRSALKGAAKGAVIGEVLEDDEPDLPKKKDFEEFDPPDSRDDVGDNVKRAKKDDDPSAAAVGAAVGAAAGRRRGKKAEAAAEAQRAEAQQASVEQAEHDDLRKAVKACLQGRGYEVE